MARTAIPTSTTNDLVTAAWFNTYLRDNEAAHWAVIGANEAAIGANEAAIGANEAAIGKIYSGRVAAAGTAIKLPSGWSSTKTATGKYTITHNLGTTNYTIVAIANNRFATWEAIATNTFTIYIYGHDNVSGDMLFQDAAFHFILIKD
jgi:hypothetical protein